MMQKFLRLSCLVLLMTLSACVITEKFEKVSADSEFNTVVVKADAAMHEGEWAKAASFYEKAAQMKPDQLDWRVKQAQAYRNGGNLAQAFNVYQLILDSNAPANTANDSAVKLAKTQLAKSGFKLEPLSKLIETKPVEPIELAEPLAKNKTLETPPPPAKIVTVDTDVAPAPVVDKKKVETLDASKAVFDELNAWRAAWQNKSMKAYFSHYVEDFSGEEKNAKTWRDERTAKIKSAKNIQVTFSDAQVNFIADDTAELKFKQHYRSGNYKDIGRKTLQFKKVDNRWLIAQEVFK
jgi:tetratricopeptide (TPR) repeat protein